MTNERLKSLEKKLSFDECLALARMVPAKLWERQKRTNYCACCHKLEIFVWAIPNAFIRESYYGIIISFNKRTLGKYDVSPDNIYNSLTRYETMKAAYKDIALSYKMLRGTDGSYEMQSVLAKTRALLRRK